MNIILCIYCTLSNIMGKTERFMNILMNFVQINTYDYFLDTDFIKALVSLNLKLNILKIPFVYDQQYDRSDGSRNS